MNKTIAERVTIMETNMTNLCDDIHEIKSNHLVHLQSDVNGLRDCIGSIKRTMTSVETDVSWMKKFFWIVATASTGALISSLINLLLK